MRMLIVLACWVAPATALEWSFERDTTDWTAGLSPLDFYLHEKTESGLRVRQGALEVSGERIERIFVDTNGLIRRGSILEQWLLSPEIRRNTQDFQRLIIRFRAPAGTEVFWQVHWITQSGRQAFEELAEQRRSNALPDSLQTKLTAYRQGLIEAIEWEAFATNWAMDDGSEYSAMVNRLRQEEDALRAVFQTNEIRLVTTGAWQTLDIELALEEGWRGELLRLGVNIKARPELLAVQMEDVPLVEPFLQIDRLELVEATFTQQ